MATVDPPLFPIPDKLLKDPELAPYFIAIQRWQHDMWSRTGGSEDLIETTIFTQVSEDGGNRNDRYLQDEIGHLQDQVASLKRQLREVKDIEPNQITYKNDYVTEEHFHTHKTSHYQEINKVKRYAKGLEQKIHELEERLDNGT